MFFFRCCTTNNKKDRYKRNTRQYHALGRMTRLLPDAIPQATKGRVRDKHENVSRFGQNYYVFARVYTANNKRDGYETKD